MGFFLNLLTKTSSCMVSLTLGCLCYLELPILDNFLESYKQARTHLTLILHLRIMTPTDYSKETVSSRKLKMIPRKISEKNMLRYQPFHGNILHQLKIVKVLISYSISTIQTLVCMITPMIL